MPKFFHVCVHSGVPLVPGNYKTFFGSSCMRRLEDPVHFPDWILMCFQRNLYGNNWGGWVLTLSHHHLNPCWRDLDLVKHEEPSHVGVFDLPFVSDSSLFECWWKVQDFGMAQYLKMWWCSNFQKGMTLAFEDPCGKKLATIALELVVVLAMEVWFNGKKDGVCEWCNNNKWCVLCIEVDSTILQLRGLNIARPKN